MIKRVVFILVCMTIGAESLALKGNWLNIFAWGSSVKGSGIIKEESRKIDPYQEISASGNVHVILMAASNASDQHTIAVHGDDNILPHIVTEVKRGVLAIHVEDWYDCTPTQPIRVTCYVKDLTRIKASGSVDIVMHETLFEKVIHTTEKTDSRELEIHASGSSTMMLPHLNVDMISVRVSGSARIICNGSARVQNVHATGSSFYDGAHLNCEEAVVKTSGAAQTLVKVTKKLSASACGSSEIRYAVDEADKGRCVVQSSTSGSASIKPM